MGHPPRQQNLCISEGRTPVALARGARTFTRPPRFVCFDMRICKPKHGALVASARLATKQVAGDYGVLIQDKGIALRGLFVIDPEGILRYKVVHDLNVGSSAEETLRVIQALQTGGLCQAEWKPGQKTLN